MAVCPEEILADVVERFPKTSTSEFRSQSRAVVSREDLNDLLACLKHDHGFDQLIDLTCVDYLNYRDAKDRFGLVYVLGRHETGQRLVVRCYLNEPNLNVPSAVPYWESANWMEREAYDMFGIVFEGHPDFKRILMPFEFTAYPLRKDYPLQGRGERHNFPTIRRDDA